MEGVLKILNEFEREGKVSRYAIGGAIAATFYIEPFVTFDLDVFVVLPQTQGVLLTLGPLYRALESKGCVAKGEYMNIEGTPVQFLPAHNPLIDEALEEASEVLYGETPTRVLRPEHLLAIMIQTGRPKDRQRFASFLEQVELDAGSLQAILERHRLKDKWHEWSSQ